MALIAASVNSQSMDQRFVPNNCERIDLDTNCQDLGL